MQGVDGEWVEIDEDDGPMEFHGACETIIAEEDRGKPFSSGSIYFEPSHVHAPYIPEQHGRMGWECPKCHACHAPHVDSCPNCLPQTFKVGFPVYPIIGDPIINPSPYVYPTPTGIYWDSNTITVGQNASDSRFDSEGYSYAPYVPTEISCEYSDPLV